MRYIGYIGALVCLIFLAGCSSSAPSSQELQKTLSRLTQQAVVVEKAFKSKSGLDAYLVSIHQKDYVVYTFHQQLILGEIYNLHSLKNLTAIDLQSNKSLSNQLSNSHAKSLSKQQYLNIQKAHSFTIGSSKAKVHLTLFIDPACIICKHYFLSLLPYVQEGTVQLQIIPINLFGSNKSFHFSARLLAVSSKRAFELLQENDSNLTETVTLQGSTDPKSLQQVASNTSIFNAIKFQGTPVTVYRMANQAYFIDGFFGKQSLNQLIEQLKQDAVNR